MIEIEQRLREAKEVLEKLEAGSEITKRARSIEAALGRYKEKAQALEAARADLAALPAEAVELVRAGQGTSAVEARLITLRAREEICSQVCEAGLAELESAWETFDHDYQVWRTGTISKTTVKELDAFVKDTTRAADLLAQWAERLEAEEERLEVIAEPRDLARLRGVRILAQGLGGALLAMQDKPGLVQLPRSDTGRASVRLYGVRNRISDSVRGDVELSPELYQLVNALALLACDLPESRWPFK